MAMPRRITLLLFLVALSGVAFAAAGPALYDYKDAELSGPEQPISFSHRVHAGELKVDCLYCHTGADKSQHATVPAVSVCWGCHQHVKQANPAQTATPGSREELSRNEIAKIQKFYCGDQQQPAPIGAQACTAGESIPWIRIHNLPEHVQFKHNRHVNAGVQCQECHGPIETMDRVYLVPDTVLRPSSAYLPAQKLEMGWCMNCHNQRGGSDDCAACHY
jgi:hypothetical protein